MSLLLRLLSLRKSIGPQIQVCEGSISGLPFFAWPLRPLVMTGMLTFMFPLCYWKATLIITLLFSMMLNTSQALDHWDNFFGHPTGSRSGLLNAIYQIGSLVSFPLV